MNATTPLYLSLVLAASACTRPAPAALAPIAGVANAPSGVTTKLERFDLTASSIDLARLYPDATVHHDVARGFVTVEGTGHRILAVIVLEPGTLNVAGITVSHRRSLASFAKEHPDATCSTDDESETTCRVARDPGVEYFVVQPDNEPGSDVPITRARGRLISMMSWTAPKPVPLVLGKTVSRNKQYPYIVAAACARVLDLANECGLVYEPERGWQVGDVSRAGRPSSIERCDLDVGADPRTWPVPIYGLVTIDDLAEAAQRGCSQLRVALDVVEQQQVAAVKPE